MSTLMACHGCREQIDRRSRVCHFCGSEQNLMLRFLAFVLSASLIFPALAQVWPLNHHHDHVQGLEVSADWFWMMTCSRISVPA